MAIVYPAALDTFNTPSDPTDTSLSSAGSSNRDHPQSHQDLGAAVMALQANAAQLSHDHSGGYSTIGVTGSTNGAIPADDIQTVLVSGSPTGGTFTLNFSGTDSSALAYNASASAVQTALWALAGSSNVLVSGGNGGPYTCVFTGARANSPQPPMTGNGASLTPSGGAVNVAHSVTGTPGGSAVQTVAIAGGPTGGTFTLTSGGYTTTPINYNATAGAVQGALLALTSIGGSNVAVTGLAGGPYTVTFQGALANTPQALIQATSSLTGGTFATSQLQMANTHQNPDTDISPLSMHHTLGTSGTNAAAGNHAHDYNGPSIYNKPYIVCTSTTRPSDPFVGQTILETDTNCWRVWGAFNANNVVSTGMEYEYFFNTANTPYNLDATIFSQSYVYGGWPGIGYMGAPQAGDCVWNIGWNTPGRCIARAIVSPFLTDQQAISFTTGLSPFGDFGSGYGAFGSGGKAGLGGFIFGFPKSPVQIPEEQIAGVATNDAYLRMSADGLSYVRFAVFMGGVAIFYTTTGSGTESFLGGVQATTTNPGTTWNCKAIGNTYTVYADGVQVLSVVDYLNAVHQGPNYRGWGIGMQTAVGNLEQFIPASVGSVMAEDIPSYSTELIWQLLSIGAVPHLRAESRYAQEVIVTWALGLQQRNWMDLLFWYVIVDWPTSHFMELEVSNSDIHVQEAGSYAVHASVCWDPNYPTFDQAAVGVSVNGQDIGRNNWEFVRGNGYFPGFAQTNDISFTYYFAEGDIVRVQLANNSPEVTHTYYNPTPPNIQTCYVTLDFLGPT